MILPLFVHAQLHEWYDFLQTILSFRDVEIRIKKSTAKKHKTTEVLIFMQ